jgi:subtilisin family serine protease
MTMMAPDQPWTPERTRTAVRGKLVVKVASGEAPERIPHYLAVAAGRSPPATRFDGGGRVDQILRRFSPAARITRAYRPAGRGDGEDWDAVEDQTGVARTYRIEIDPDCSLLRMVAELRALAVVDAVSPHYLSVTPFGDPPAPRPSDRLYAHRMVGVKRALAFEPGDASLIVAVIDSGVALDHAEFAGRLRPGFDTVDLPKDQVSRGITLIGDTHTPDRHPGDEMGHGTACASIIGAHGRRVPPGAAGAARILPARALAAGRFADRNTLTAVGALPDIDNAVKLAVDLGARVLNLSFGTPESALRTDDPRPHGDVITYALERGCILVAASGNSGTTSRYYPAAHPGVITVGSVNEHGRPSSFTTRGDHVALCAPGEHIPTAGLDGYQTNTGTSFAAPFVAGACALLLSRAARYGAPLGPGAVLSFLRAHARRFPIDVDVTGCGAGILDLSASLAGLEHALARAEAPMSRIHPIPA